MSWRNEKTLSNETLDRIFHIATSEDLDEGERLKQIRILALDQSNDEQLDEQEHGRVAEESRMAMLQTVIRKEMERYFGKPNNTVTCSLYEP